MSENWLMFEDSDVRLYSESLDRFQRIRFTYTPCPELAPALEEARKEARLGIWPLTDFRLDDATGVGILEMTGPCDVRLPSLLRITRLEVSPGRGVLPWKEAVERGEQLLVLLDHLESSGWPVHKIRPYELFFRADKAVLNAALVAITLGKDSFSFRGSTVEQPYMQIARILANLLVSAHDWAKNLDIKVEHASENAYDYIPAGERKYGEILLRLSGLRGRLRYSSLAQALEDWRRPASELQIPLQPPPSIPAIHPFIYDLRTRAYLTVPPADVDPDETFRACYLKLRENPTELVEWRGGREIVQPHLTGVWQLDDQSFTIGDLLSFTVYVGAPPLDRIPYLFGLYVPRDASESVLSQMRNLLAKADLDPPDEFRPGLFVARILTSAWGERKSKVALRAAVEWAGQVDP